MSQAIVPAKEPVPPATPPPIEIVPAPTTPSRSLVRPMVGAALAFAAREIAPRVARELLAAWDRRRPTDLTLREHPPLAGPLDRLQPTRTTHRRRQHRRGRRVDG